MKHVHRFFVFQPVSSGQAVYLDADDSFHASRVLRLKPGDRIELADVDGKVFEAVVAVADGSVEVVAGTRLEDQGGVAVADGQAVGGLTVVQALPGGRKMDLIVEKLSEIGISRVVPAFSEKSVARASSGRDEKMKRWRRIAMAAASQSKRRTVMAVEAPVALDEWSRGFTGVMLVLATEAEAAPLGRTAAELVRGDMTGVSGARERNDVAGVADRAGLSRPLALVVGPEGGFSPAEIGLFGACGGRFVTLGPLVLRTETAALVAATVIMHRMGVIG